jgi:cyclophilin family peptidyl-prolyl cis-trans isomerase
MISPASAAPPTLASIPDVVLFSGSPLHLALDGSGAEGDILTFSATSSDELVSTFVTQGNRSLRFTITGYGVMVFEIFDARVPRATQQISQLAESGFYNGVIFHRIVNDFVIQGGDPTGTGAGGSDLPDFDDQYHVDLQHNRTGLLSMAKGGDDSNNSQFFVTEGSQRHLDFNHSIFGLLVEGEDVREAISNVAVDSTDRPLADVVMEKVEVFVDAQNAVLMLKAPEGAVGFSRITVTVTNQNGEQSEHTFRVDVLPDEFDSPPFLADIPPIRTKVDTPVTVQLQAIDVEGDPAQYLDEETLSINGLSVPVMSPANLDYSVDFETGLLTVTPTNGLTGEYFISVATATAVTAVDYQAVPVIIEP